jgi:serum/glucocorticoid-regulated kinase 2
MHYAF